MSETSYDKLLIGFADATCLDTESVRLKDWLANAYNGQMAFLAKDPLRRCDPRMIMPDCKTVIVVAMRYSDMPLRKHENTNTRKYEAKYLQHEDYHKVMLEKLEAIVGELKKEHSDAHFKCYVDTGPVLEKRWAARAGLGFIGKNTLLISPEHGSQMALGVILCSAVMRSCCCAVRQQDSRTARQQDNLCGSCRKCLNACPTGALVAPYTLDARKCISYKFFIEKNTGGCDTCQDVCPFNQCVSSKFGVRS